MADRLVPSPRDVIEGVAHVSNHYNEVLVLYFRLKKEHLRQAPAIDTARRLVQRMVKRYQLNDFRHTASELKALKELAQWNLDMKADLCNQPRKKVNL